MKIHKILLLFLLSISIISCIGDVDFNQTDDITLDPVVKVSILYFNATNIDFVDPLTNTPILFISDTTETHFFDSDIAQDDIKKIVLKFKIENTFNKTFDLNYTFLDENDDVSLTIPFNILNNNILEQEISYENTDLEDLLNAKKIVTTVNLGADLNQITADMFLDFDSAADIYLKIELNEN